MDGLILISADPAPSGPILLAVALLLVGGVIGAMLGSWAAEMDRFDR